MSQDEQEGNKPDVKAVSEEDEEECVFSILDGEVIPKIYGIFSTRVFDIFNIKLHPKTSKCGSDGKLCAISGSVQVVDEGLNTRYNVYYRKQSEAEIIKCGGELLLPGFPVIQISKVLKVLVNLYCTAHNAMIADGSFDLDYSTSEYKFNQVIVKDVEGEDGMVSVSHITFQHARVVLVEQIVVEGNDAIDPNLYGTIAMDLKGTHAHYFDKYAGIPLFDNSLSNSAPVNYNHDIKLLRSCLVVPSFHSPIIKLQFHDTSGQPKIVKEMVLERGAFNLFEERVNENSIIKISIKFLSFDEGCPRDKKSKQKLTAEQIFLSNIDSSIVFQTKQVVAQGQSAFAYMPYDIRSFVEVFSVLPCIQDNDLGIHGTIRLIDSSDNVCSIFEGPEKWFKSKPLTITCYPSSCDCTEDGFRIEVDMKGTGGCTVGKGKVYWNDSQIVSRSNRHICSVFEGDTGFVAIHYCMISKSVLARITTSLVQIVQGPQVSLNVFGNIKAGYAGYEYATFYDQDFYRSTLFSRDLDECVEVELGSGLPLSKSVVAVPADDSLILDVKLRVKLGEDKEFETIEKQVSFKPYACGLYAIDIGHYALSMCVQWSDGKDANAFNSSVPIPDKRLVRISKLDV